MFQGQFYYLILKLLNRLFGIFLVLASVVLLLSLFSFNSSDPSFNTVSTEDVISNWMGAFGSYTADLCFQLIGLSAFFVCLIIFVIGFKIASKDGVRYLLPKLIITPFCILCFAAFFATLPQPDWWSFNSLGGVNGKFIVAKLTEITAMPDFAIGFLALLISLLTISLIIEISIHDWIYFGRYSYATARFLAEKIAENFMVIVAILSKNNKFLASHLAKVKKKEEAVIARKAKVSQSQIKKVITDLKSGAIYQLPPYNLLIDRSEENKNKKINPSVIEEQSRALMKVLEDFGIRGKSLGYSIGPVVTLHEFEPAAGIKASRIIGLADDIARSMSASSARIAVISGKTTLGIEIPNSKREMIFLREMIESNEYRYSQNFLSIILGKDISGAPMVVDLAKMPHLLIAGTTGSGKSVGLNVMILSILFRMPPDECRFIMIDPKMLELSIYDGIPHLLAPVVTEAGKAVIALKWVVNEMEQRYRLMSSLNVRNIAGYNEKAEKAISSGKKLTKKVQTGYDPQSGEPIVEEIEFEAKKLPFIVVIVDEMADLMLVAGKEIESSVQRLAQMARAAGIHLIMATQRPSVDVITGVIKANFPTRISFQVTSRIDSRTILGVQGAEQLLGQGDMIYMSGGSKMTRVHGPFCSDAEIEEVVNFIKSQKTAGLVDEQKINFEAQDFEGDESDGESGSDLLGESGNSEEDLYQKAVGIVRRDNRPSISYVQRQLRIGYNKAANLIERMEKEGIVTPPSVSGKREVIE